MLIDYLRYQAFSGRLQSFFTEGLSKYVDPKETTGQHLRFAPEWIDELWGYYAHDLMERSFSSRLITSAANQLGLKRHSGSILQSEVTLGERPPTHKYEEDVFPHLQIIIDIDPSHWGERFSEQRSYEDIPIVYRRSGPARANFGTGDRLVDRFQERAGYGTLCGVFETDAGQAFGLTCGHVTRDRGEVLVEHPRRLWKLNFGSTYSAFGSTLHHTICGPEVKIGNVTTQLDAALVAAHKRIKRSREDRVINHAYIKPIASVLQEEPVHFKGASRHSATLARVSAVTVRKSIDLYNDGTLHSVGDVLMLGHRERMYMVQQLSRPGDSGSAVRFGLSKTGPFETINQWYGMVLGGDEQSTYASHAEFIWAWAAQCLPSENLDFYF